MATTVSSLGVENSQKIRTPSFGQMQALGIEAYNELLKTKNQFCVLGTTQNRNFQVSQALKKSLQKVNLFCAAFPYLKVEELTHNETHRIAELGKKIFTEFSEIFAIAQSKKRLEDFLPKENFIPIEPLVLSLKGFSEESSSFERLSTLQKLSRIFREEFFPQQVKKTTVKDLCDNYKEISPFVKKNLGTLVVIGAISVAFQIAKIGWPDFTYSVENTALSLVPPFIYQTIGFSNEWIEYPRNLDKARVCCDSNLDNIEEMQVNLGSIFHCVFLPQGWKKQFNKFSDLESCRKLSSSWFEKASSLAKYKLCVGLNYSQIEKSKAWSAKKWSLQDNPELEICKNLREEDHAFLRFHKSDKKCLGLNFDHLHGSLKNPRSFADCKFFDEKLGREQLEKIKDGRGLQCTLIPKEWIQRMDSFLSFKYQPALQRLYLSWKFSTIQQILTHFSSLLALTILVKKAKEVWESNFIEPTSLKEKCKVLTKQITVGTTAYLRWGYLTGIFTSLAMWYISLNGAHALCVYSFHLIASTVFRKIDELTEHYTNMSRYALLSNTSLPSTENPSFMTDPNKAEKPVEEPTLREQAAKLLQSILGSAPAT